MFSGFFALYKYRLFISLVLSTSYAFEVAPTASQVLKPHRCAQMTLCEHDGGSLWT